jgi:hypothetical protein
MQPRDSIGKETVIARNARLSKTSLRIGHFPPIGGSNRPIAMTAQTLALLTALRDHFFLMGRSESLIGRDLELVQF